MGLTCWQCGVEPTEVADVTSLGGRRPRYLPTRWPDGDHEHAVTPPTPDDLVADGHRVLRRILEA